MFQIIKQHVYDNYGDENTSKMTMVAIVFVVGAILLLLTTTAFQEPIQQWYQNTIAEWFAEDNGQYSFDPWSMYDKNDNGTYKGLEYILYGPNGSYQVLSSPENIVDGDIFTCSMKQYDANGNWDGKIWDYLQGTVEISSDGRTIVVDGEVYCAQRP